MTAALGGGGGGEGEIYQLSAVPFEYGSPFRRLCNINNFHQEIIRRTYLNNKHFDRLIQ